MLLFMHVKLQLHMPYNNVWVHYYGAECSRFCGNMGTCVHTYNVCICDGWMVGVIGEEACSVRMGKSV